MNQPQFFRQLLRRRHRPASALDIDLADVKRRAGLDNSQGVLLALGGSALIGLIALLDYGTGPQLSIGIFYLIPVVVGAWWGGFSHGILLSLGAAIAWHVVDTLENPLVLLPIELWNSIARFGTLVLASSLVSRLHASVLREQLLARTDPLTKAANGRTFYECVAVETERARRSSKPLTLAYLDLDNFKQLNDRLGHAAGDAALVRAVQTIRENLRAADLLARLGGDEFALLLPETDDRGAVPLLHRLQELLAQEMQRNGWPVTVSIGAITFLRPHWDVDLMIQRIDALMYCAKRKGKGRVEYAIEANNPQADADHRAPVERRATARILCTQAARVWQEGEEDAPGFFATVCDVSVDGVAVYLERRFQADTVLIVEPLTPGAKTLLGCVVRSERKEGGGWVHGCKLPTELTQEELDAWICEMSNQAAQPSAS